MDILLSDTGDLVVSATGDIALVPDRYHHYVQQAYIRLMTEIGDFALYPALGASLERLYGMPNTPETGQFGVSLIQESLNRENIFAGIPLDIKAIPTGQEAIRFDVYITLGSRTELIASIEQDLVFKNI